MHGIFYGRAWFFRRGVFLKGVHAGCVSVCWHLWLCGAGVFTLSYVAFPFFGNASWVCCWAKHVRVICKGKKVGMGWEPVFGILKNMGEFYKTCDNKRGQPCQ